ncbi:MAG TPA: hypothetical protein VFT55_15705 [Planctomycetota bacterium]|nr:hypothetical protein [Planctomycetota bacterium]
MVRGARRERATALAACALGLAAAPLAAQEPEPVRLRNVEIRTRDVFADEDADGNPFYWLANALHMVTREHVVACENWLRPGDSITSEQIAELERNLRASHLFGAVAVSQRPAGDGMTDLVIDTRDKFSLNLSASLSRVGGVDKFGVRAAESNLFGTGKQLALAANEKEDEYERYVRFTDPQLLGSWHRFSIRTGRTEEGPFTSVELVRPLKHLEDPYSYGARYSGVDEDQDYYRFGESTAELPLRRHSVQLFAAGAAGPRDARSTRGLELRLSTSEYGAATGPDRALVRVPGDTDAIELGPYFAYALRSRYDKVTRLDAIDYVEDLELGISLLGRVAARLRDEQGVGSDVDPVLGAGVRIATQPLAETYVTFAGEGSVAWGGDGLHTWNGRFALHAYQMSLRPQTLCASLTYDFAGETRDPVPQLTLGEDNGLRGYPAREFAGSRFTRLNLEDRIDTGIEVLSVRLGLVAFADAGWVHGPQQGLSMGEAIRSVGCGLRFGSSHLFGGGVGRLDIAWPLDDVDGNSYGVSVSFSIGQVFTFFGNANELNTGFQ